MKKIITLALISIITSNINAQFDATNMTFSDGERYIMNKWTPKNGKTSDFMKAAGKKTKLFNNSPENAISFAPHRIFNIGNSKSINLLYFIETIEKELGKKAKKIYEPIQAGDVLSTYSDTNRLEK